MQHVYGCPMATIKEFVSAFTKITSSLFFSLYRVNNTISCNLLVFRSQKFLPVHACMAVYSEGYDLLGMLVVLIQFVFAYSLLFCVHLLFEVRGVGGEWCSFSLLRMMIMMVFYVEHESL